MPTDDAAREYTLYLANKIRHSSAEYKYGGNLISNFKRLGLNLEQLNQSLNAKNPIATNERELFRKMILGNKRQVEHWNQLTDDVLMKE